MFCANYMTENYINCKNHANFVYFTAPCTPHNHHTHSTYSYIRTLASRAYISCLRWANILNPIFAASSVRRRALHIHKNVIDWRRACHRRTQCALFQLQLLVIASSTRRWIRFGYIYVIPFYLRGVSRIYAKYKCRIRYNSFARTPVLSGRLMLMM